MKRTPLFGLGIGLAGALLIAGCSAGRSSFILPQSSGPTPRSDTPSTDSDQPPAVPQAWSNPCGLLTGDQASQVLDQPGIEAKPTPPVSGPDPGGVVNTCDYTLSTDGGDEPVFFLTVFAKAGKANAALAFLRQYSGSTEGKDLKQISGLGTAAVSYTSTIAGQVVNGEKIPASQSFDVVFARSSGKDAVGFDCGAVAGSLTNPPASLLNLAKRVAATLPQP